MNEEQAKAIINSATGLTVGEALNAIDVARELATALAEAVETLDCRFVENPCGDPACLANCSTCIAYIDGTCRNPDHYELRA